MEFKIAYCNGATVSEGFGHLDRVQQLTPVALETVLARGADARRHVLLPLGFAIDPRANPVDAQERSALRERLRLPADRRIVLSVAALNRRIKRIDYVIEEVARMPEPRPYLLLLGQPEAETPALRELARSRLGESGHEIRSVRPTEVAGFYRASDLFVLASLGEAFGRALVEAMVQGLPCLAHDYGITRYVLGEHGLLADLSKPGALSGLLASGAALDQTSAEARHRFVYERFSWDRLRPAYVEFLSAAAGRHRSARANNTVSSSTGDAVRTKNR
jgi:glycosyltransferase involved in cell wall biosynthesis